MKTPEEIKKELACESLLLTLACTLDCDNCERYVPGYESESCAADALAYIQHLETRLTQAEREKQALLHDMKHVAPVEICEACAHSMSESKCEENDFNCDKCPEDCPCKTCRDCRENFQWRGICADNTKEENHEN